MWFHHVRQSPDTEGRTIAVNYCKSSALCQDVFTDLDHEIEKKRKTTMWFDIRRRPYLFSGLFLFIHLDEIPVQGMTCNLI